MNDMKHAKHRTLITAAIAILLPGLAWSEVIHHQINEENLLVRVSGEAWQPDLFKNGTTVPAVYVGRAEITVDGYESEPQWRLAPEVTVPLKFGGVTQAGIKALYNDSEVFIRVRWKDDLENREHHPWTWDAVQARYTPGPQVEDSVLLSFEAGCEWFPSLLGGYVYDFDGWHWMAGRTDPLGQAVDISGTVQDRDLTQLGFVKYPSRNAKPVWNLKFTDARQDNFHDNWDQLDRAYLLQPVTDTVYVRAKADGYRPPPFIEPLAPPAMLPANAAQTFPSFRAVKLKGEAGEVAARGQWEDGYWTVEFRRVRETPAGILNDSVFNRLTQFSVLVFDGVEHFDEASESGRLFLQFMEMEERADNELRFAGD